MVQVKLPSEVRYVPGRSHHIDIIPPAWWSPTYPLAVLHVAQQVRQLQTCIWTRVIPTNQDGVCAIFLVPDIAEHFRSTREEVAFKFGPYRHLEVSMLERQRSTVVEREAEVSPQGLVDQHLPHPCKDLTPTTFAVSHIAFLVKVVTPTMRHQVMVTSMEEPFLNTAKVISKALDFRSSWHIGRHGFTPFGHGFLKRKAPLTVKHRMEPCSPAF